MLNLGLLMLNLLHVHQYSNLTQMLPLQEWAIYTRQPDLDM